MVQLMGSAMAESKSKGSKKTAAVKFELDDSSEPLQKRAKFLSSSLQENIGVSSSSMYNPLDEPSPLGLRLRKSPSLLDLIQMKLSQDSAAKLSTLGKKTHKGTAISSSTDKLKASNFPGSVLKIGTWQYKSRYEGDLVAKCYFAKHKLVWEVLDGSLKNKIEIQWSDIVAIKGTYSDDSPGSLDVVLSRPPLFFRETNPQPRKHTLWQTTSDFTGGQATMNRRHFLHCPPGMLGKHFEKLVQCDPRLQFLSQQPEIVLESPYFEPRAAPTGDLNEIGRLEYDAAVGPALFGIQDGGMTSSSGADSSSRTEHDFLSIAPPESYSSEISSPSSEFKSLKLPGNWDRIKVPGLNPSMSVSDLVSHIEHCISEKMTSSSSNNPTVQGKQLQNDKGILDEISQYLFSETQLNPTSDEKSLMSRVNSLYSLLQRAPSTAQLFNPRTGDGSEAFGANSNEVSDCKQAQAISRKDSFGDLLLSLPRIASLPQFLFNLAQDSSNQAR